MEFWTCGVCGFEIETSEPKQVDEERGVCSVCAESHKVDVNKQDGSWIVKVKTLVYVGEGKYAFTEIVEGDFGPFTNIENVEKCLVSLSGKENVFSAKVEHIK